MSRIGTGMMKTDDDDYMRRKDNMNSNICNIPTIIPLSNYHILFRASWPLHSKQREKEGQSSKEEGHQTRFQKC